MSLRNLFESTTFRQHAKTVIVGLSVLTATFSATLLTGWITSRKTAPETVAGPRISFRVENDLLTAEADKAVDDWHYVGPRRQSTCDESIFDNFLGFGQTFKEGDTLRLDFQRDNNRYYCFKAVAGDGTVGFGFHYVTELPRPVISFRQTAGELTAGLSSHAAAGDYAGGWQHVLLGSSHAACSETAFADPARTADGRSVELDDSETDRHYCFRLRTAAGGYVYRLALVPAGENAPPAINALVAGRQLYLLADQKIKNWAAAEAGGGCGPKNFADTDSYRLSSEQTPAINLDSAAAGLDGYCIRAQNPAGVYSYRQFAPEEERPAVTVAAGLQAGRLTLAAGTAVPAGGWQIRRAASLEGCLPDSFAELETVSNGRRYTVGYPTSRQRIYCFRATAAGDAVYGSYRVPPADNLIGTYRVGGAVKAHSIYPELDAWQHIARQADEGTAGGHCSAADFTLNAEVGDGRSVDFSRPGQYCFRARDRAGVFHYGRWFAAVPEPETSRADEAAALLADELGLNELGRVVFYQTRPRFYDKPSELRKACGETASAGCYLPEDNRFHVLDAARDAGGLLELKRSLAQAARLSYLSAEQRAAQAFEILLIYRGGRAYFDRLLPADFYDGRLYEDELAAGLHDALVALPAEEVGDAAWQASWAKWREALFE